MKIQKIKKYLKENKFKIYLKDSTTSTMDEAKILSKEIKENFIILSKEQTQGKGRLGKKWISPVGNIYCSFVISNIHKDFSKICMLTCIAIKKSLEHIGVKNVTFKWPNDIYIKNKKISGILQELFIDNFKTNRLIIGVGINIFISPKLKNIKTTHVAKYVKDLQYGNFFEIFINYFFFCLKFFYFEKKKNLVYEYKKSLVFLNKKIIISLNNNKKLTGKLSGINNDGSLLLISKKKNIRVYAGEIIE